MVSAVYFDLDGTLFDDHQYVRGGLRHAGDVLADRTGVDLTDELLDAYFKRGITESTFDTVLSEHELSSELVPMLVDVYHDNRAELSPVPEANITLSKLADEYQLGLITGGKNGREKLARLGLDEYFETVFVSPEYGVSKHHPDIFEAALDTLSVPASQAVYVGDRPSLDFPQPNRLGMITVRVQTGRYAEAEATGTAQPDHTLDSLSELPAVIDSLSAQTNAKRE